MLDCRSKNDAGAVQARSCSVEKHRRARLFYMVKLRCDGQVLAERRWSAVVIEVLALRVECAAHGRLAACTPRMSSVSRSTLA
jgi:hypothetical protein